MNQWIELWYEFYKLEHYDLILFLHDHHDRDDVVVGVVDGFVITVVDMDGKEDVDLDLDFDLSIGSWICCGNWFGNTNVKICDNDDDVLLVVVAKVAAVAAAVAVTTAIIGDNYFECDS